MSIGILYIDKSAMKRYYRTALAVQENMAVLRSTQKPDIVGKACDAGHAKSGKADN